MQQFVLYFSRPNKKNGVSEMEAIVRVTIDPELKVPKFDVDLNSLPTPILQGFEVITHWHAHDFDNKGVFYTDSNGLEMQKRQLNYR